MKCELPKVPLSPTQLDCLEKITQRIRCGEWRLEPLCCPCGTPGDYVLVSHDRYGLPIPTVLCKACGLGRTSLNLDQRSTEHFYRDFYRALYLGNRIPTEEFLIDQIRRGANIIGNIPEALLSEVKTVVDVGCGAGGMLFPFLARGMEVYGCDYGQEYVSYGRRLGLPLSQGGIDAVAQPRVVDMILLSHVLEHSLCPESFLKQLCSRLSPRGLLVVEVPGLLAVHNYYKSSEWVFHLAHPFHFSLSTMNRLMARSGFELVTGDESLFAVYRKCEPFDMQIDGATFVSAREYYRHIDKMFSRTKGNLLGRAYRAIARIAVGLKKRGDSIN